MRKAFTLIELLVVIAVIAILAALLFPVFARARERARQTSCGSNMRQIYVAMQAYMDDSDGVYPWAYTYLGSYGSNLPHPMLPEALAPYTRNGDIFRCPSDCGETFISDPTGYHKRTRPFWEWHESSYDWAGLEGPFPRAAGRSVSSIKKPCAWPLIFEPRPWHGMYSTVERATSSKARHNVVYCDGHLATRTRYQWAILDTSVAVSP